MKQRATPGGKEWTKVEYGVYRHATGIMLTMRTSPTAEYFESKGLAMFDDRREFWRWTLETGGTNPWCERAGHDRPPFVWANRLLRTLTAKTPDGA